MRLGGMQPYFFPYLGYFALIKHTDQWIVADNVQHIDRGWIERNRILSPPAGWNYIKVPLEKASHKALINERKIRNDEKWKTKIEAQLAHYKRIAPYYQEVKDLVEEILSIQTDSILELNIRSLERVCQELEISFHYTLASQLDIDTSQIREPDDWPLQIALMLGADEYINPPGGISFYNKEKFDRHQIQLKFLKVHLQPYQQNGAAFEPGLSIIDVMMFNSVEKIHEMLDDFEYIE